MATEDKPYPEPGKLSQDICQNGLFPHIRGSHGSTLTGKKAAAGDTGACQPDDKDIFPGELHCLPQLER